MTCACTCNILPEIWRISKTNAASNYQPCSNNAPLVPPSEIVMKTVILAGGLGPRLREETEFRPKPMVEIGGRPILWHIMKGYAHHGFNEFVLCLGYKGDMVRDYFLNYEIHNRDVTVTLGSRDVDIHNTHAETAWRVTPYLDERFMVTYGDGVADIDLKKLLAFHVRHGKLGTVTAVHPASRFGELAIADGLVKVFQEKPQVHEGWINGGVTVFHPPGLG